METSTHNNMQQNKYGPSQGKSSNVVDLMKMNYNIMKDLNNILTTFPFL